MSQPLFKNENPYTISVPTPYGSSINVPSQKYVAGSYFNRYYAATMTLKLMPVGTVVQPNSIICSYELVTNPAPTTTVVQSSVVNTAPILDPQTVPVIMDKPVVSQSIEEAPINKKNKGGRPRRSISEAANEMWKDVTFVLPSASEVDGLSNEKLSSLAQKLEVSAGLPRTELIQNIKLKLG